VLKSLKIKDITIIFKNVIGYTLKASLVPIIIPGLAISLLFYHFGMKTETILLIVIIAQLYIIILQTDISLRQHLVLELQHQPLFEIRNCGEFYGIRNVGNYPAYNVFLGFTEVVNNEKNLFPSN